MCDTKKVTQNLQSGVYFFQRYECYDNTSFHASAAVSLCACASIQAQLLSGSCVSSHHPSLDSCLCNHNPFFSSTSFCPSLSCSPGKQEYPINMPSSANCSKGLTPLRAAIFALLHRINQSNSVQKYSSSIKSVCLLFLLYCLFFK